MIRRLPAGFSLNGRLRQEAYDVPEPVRKDCPLEKLVRIRRQRIEKSERDCLRARQYWRECRLQLRQKNQGSKEAESRAQQCWQQARRDFFDMSISSGQFRAAKAAFKKMQAAAAEMRVLARAAAKESRLARVAYFRARTTLAEVRKQAEKLDLMSEELRRADGQEE